MLRLSLLNKALEGRRTVFNSLGDMSVAVGAAGAKVLGQAAWHTSTEELCLEWRDAAHLCTANVRALRRQMGGDEAEKGAGSVTVVQVEGWLAKG